MKLKSLILMAMLAISANVFAYTAYTPISAVHITSHETGDVVFAGSTITLACTTSTDYDCSGSYRTVQDSVVHAWSAGSGTFNPSTGTSNIQWTAPSTVGNVTITVTADDNTNPTYYNDAAVSDSVTLTVKDVIFVDADATGSNNGTSWANAYVSLQDALGDASAGNQIWVAEGIYYPDEGTGRTDNNPFETFELVDDVNVYGGFDGSETALSQRDYVNNETILSGDIDKNDTLDTSNSYEVVYNWSNTTTLDGFTVEMGWARYESDTRGGGIGNICTSSVTIKNCIIRNNRATYGGGIGNYYATSTIITDCKFIDNQADLWGAGVEDYAQSDTTYHGCLFVGNQTLAASKIGGSAIDVWAISEADIENCTFVENDTIGDDSGALYSGWSSSVTAKNSIFWNNTDITDNYDITLEDGGSVAISYCDVNSGCYNYGGTLTASNNIYSDPFFADEDANDFHLQSTEGRWNGSSWVTDNDDSPCIDTGDPSSSYSNEPTPNGSRINMGMYGNTSEASKSN